MDKLSAAHRTPDSRLLGDGAGLLDIKWKLLTDVAHIIAKLNREEGLALKIRQ